MPAVIVGRGQYGDTGRKVAHPEHLRGTDAIRVLIDDLLADPIQKGDRLLGWEGDERYALYVNHNAGRWELWRLEADNVYRMSVAVPGFVHGGDIVPWLVSWLVDHDGTRGFDPAQAAIDETVAAERAKAKVREDRDEENADRLHHALLKDIGALEGGLTRRLHPIPEAPALIKET